MAKFVKFNLRGSKREYYLNPEHVTGLVQNDEESVAVAVIGEETGLVFIGVLSEVVAALEAASDEQTHIHLHLSGKEDVDVAGAVATSRAIQRSAN